jgi:hypothetical protein
LAPRVGSLRRRNTSGVEAKLTHLGHCETDAVDPFSTLMEQQLSSAPVRQRERGC